jgi:protein-S-isoprenylcysteine O-methyltransferase Ste14
MDLIINSMETTKQHIPDIRESTQPDQVHKTNKLVSYILQTVDSLIYMFIGPFSVLYIIPSFFREIELSLGIELQRFHVLDVIGTALLWVGLGIALWCATLMAINRLGSVVPFFKPTALVTSGPFSQVRHPMMLVLFIILFGEVLIYSSPLSLLWLVIFIRFSNIYIGKFEEPYLHEHFGELYKEYSGRVPRWCPKCLIPKRTISR